jgi:hypothetical protein
VNNRPALARVLVGAWAYALIAFAAGFALAPLRILVLEPRIGPVAAVLTEAPVMLVVSYLAARWVLRRLSPRLSPVQRATLGGLAFLVLQAAELSLALLMGGAAADYAAKLSTTAGLLGLAAQLIFGAIPLLMSAPPRSTD